MKPRALILVLFISFFINVHAQTNDTLKHSVYIGYGVATLNYWVVSSLYGIPFPFLFSWAIKEYEPHYSGAFSVGYQYSVSQKLSVGATIAYEKIKLQRVSPPYSYTGNYYTLLAGTKFKYFTNKRVTFYGRADLGVLLFDSESQGDDENAIKITPSGIPFQISPVCLSIGNKYLAFCELGVGSLGFINAGLAIRF